MESAVHAPPIVPIWDRCTHHCLELLSKTAVHPWGEGLIHLVSKYTMQWHLVVPDRGECSGWPHLRQRVVAAHSGVGLGRDHDHRWPGRVWAAK